MLFYHFVLLSPLSIVSASAEGINFYTNIYLISFQFTGINLDHMLCAAVSDPFQGQNYRLFACCHQALLCPLLVKGTSFLFGSSKSSANENGLHNSMDTYVATTDGDHVIYHQLPQQQQQQDYASAEPIAAEYTMPTTKID